MICYKMNIFLYIVKHKLFKNTFIYTSSNVIGSAIPFLLLPILTRYLTPYDYGIVATFQVLLAIAVVFVGLNLRGAVSVNFFKLNKEELKIYIGNAIFIEIISFVFILCIIYIFKTYLAQLIKFPAHWLPIIIVAALGRSIFMINLTLWQVEQKALPYALFQILHVIINVGLSLILVVMLGWKWQGRLFSIVAAAIIFGVLSILIIRKRQYIVFSFNKKYVKDALFFGIPLIPHALGGWIATSIDRIFINSMVNIAATGVYVVGYQVGMIIGLLATSFNQTWTPFLFEKLKNNRRATKIKIVKFTYLYFVAIIVLALILSFFAPSFLGFFVGKSFYSAYKYVLWIALAYAAGGMYFMVVNYIFYVKKTYILAWITFLGAGVNIGLNYFLIKANGAIGAAQATMISFFLTFFMVWILSAKVYPMPWFSFWKNISH